MSQTAQTDFARIAQQLAEALDKHRPTQGNQTLVVLSELAGQLPEDNPLRLSIEQQMAKIAATDFNLDNQDLNKTLIILGTLKGRLSATDGAQDKIDVLMAKVLSAKFDIVNGQQSQDQPSTSSFSPISIPDANDSDDEDKDPPVEPVTPEVDQAKESDSSESSTPSITIPEPPTTDTPSEAVDEPAKIEPLTEPTDSPADSSPETTESTDQPEPAAAESTPNPDSSAPATDFADQIHTLQLAFDQVPESTRQAFDELKAIQDQGGSIQSNVDAIVAQSNGDNHTATERVKAELERLSVLIAKIEDAPAEADQFQVLYDQVDAKHKDLKTGVFSIFQREYGGNARRFVVERTAQYAKYVPADESRQRMIEDLHKLIEQAQKSLGQAPAKGGSNDKAKSNNRAFFHG